MIRVAKTGELSWRLQTLKDALEGIPASSVTSERAFSSAANICTKLRNRLLPEKLDLIILGRAFYTRLLRVSILQHIKRVYNILIIILFFPFFCICINQSLLQHIEEDVRLKKRDLAGHAVCCLKKKCKLIMSSRDKSTFMNGTGLNLALPHFQSPILLDKGWNVLCMKWCEIYIGCTGIDSLIFPT